MFMNLHGTIILRLYSRIPSCLRTKRTRCLVLGSLSGIQDPKHRERVHARYFHIQVLQGFPQGVEGLGLRVLSSCRRAVEEVALKSSFWNGFA